LINLLCLRRMLRLKRQLTFLGVASRRRVEG